MQRSALRLLAIAAFFSVVSSVLAQMVEIPTLSNSVSRLGEDQSSRLEIRRSAHRVTLYRCDKTTKSYRIAIGRTGWETPLGTFHVFQMIRDPAWKHPLSGKIFAPGEPGNELGGYWIGFAKKGDNCVGFHATPHPETVGKSLSHGCIRMYEKDIAELFAQVDVGTAVTVLP